MSCRPTVRTFCPQRCSVEFFPCHGSCDYRCHLRCAGSHGKTRHRKTSGTGRDDFVRITEFLLVIIDRHPVDNAIRDDVETPAATCIHWFRRLQWCSHVGCGVHADKSNVCLEANRHWRRQLWRTVARAPWSLRTRTFYLHIISKTETMLS